MAPIVTAEQFAAFCAMAGYPIEDCIVEMVRDYPLSETQAREILLEARRERQEVDITDVHDELEDEHRA